jgi:Ca2+:H+ antiporter
MPQVRNGESSPLLGGNSNGTTAQDTGKWHTEDPRPFIRYPAIVARTTWQVLASNYVNVLLVFVPVGIIAGAMGWNPTTVFILNFFAIVPLASLLSFATEELAAKLGETIGGLMNASFGNAVELIVGLRR